MPRWTLRASALAVLAALALGGCAGEGPAVDMNALAERYVKLVLAVGQHDPAYVDAYYGPPEWQETAKSAKRSLSEIDDDAARLVEELGAGRAGKAGEAGGAGTAGESPRRPGPFGPGDGSDEDELVALRNQYLERQLASMRARISMLSGKTLRFDEESRLLYDAVAPSHPDTYFAGTLAELDRRLPGPGALIDRYDAWRRDFVIPAARLGTVFDAAIAECRARTLKHVELPSTERFTVEYVTNKSWSGYNWYQGEFRSLIQINTDLPIYIDRAIDLACHEGYPGHHVYNALLEKRLVRDRGWVESSVYALFSPQSLIAEGTANYGIEVAFSSEDRLAFERDVLFPAAGLNPARVGEYYEIQGTVDRLSYAQNEAARRYLNGEIDRKGASEWLTRLALMSPPRAEQRTRFMDDYRSYVINYNLGKDLVRQHVEARAGAGADAAQRWAEFVRLLGSPRLPSGLETSAAR